MVQQERLKECRTEKKGRRKEQKGRRCLKNIFGSEKMA